MCRKFLFIITGLFIIIFAEAQRAEDFLTVADDGAWCWFSDPRSIYYKGIHERIYTGFVTSQGDIMVSSEDLHSGDKEETILYSRLQADDHVNPSLLFLPDGRLMVFFSRHGGMLYHTTSLRPEDI